MRYATKETENILSVEDFVHVTQGKSVFIITGVSHISRESNAETQLGSSIPSVTARIHEPFALNDSFKKRLSRIFDLNNEHALSTLS